MGALTAAVFGTMGRTVRASYQCTSPPTRDVLGAAGVPARPHRYCRYTRPCNVSFVSDYADRRRNDVNMACLRTPVGMTSIRHLRGTLSAPSAWEAAEEKSPPSCRRHD